MEGVLEDAEENIDNDFGNSWKLRAEIAQKEADKANEKFAEMKARAEKAEATANNKIASADGWCAKYHEASDMATENWNKFREQEDKVAELEQQIITLKAKLYDMITGAAK